MHTPIRMTHSGTSVGTWHHHTTKTSQWRTDLHLTNDQKTPQKNPNPVFKSTYFLQGWQSQPPDPHQLRRDRGAAPPGGAPPPADIHRMPLWWCDQFTFEIGNNICRCVSCTKHSGPTRPPGNETTKCDRLCFREYPRFHRLNICVCLKKYSQRRRITVYLTNCVLTYRESVDGVLQSTGSTQDAHRGLFNVDAGTAHACGSSIICCGDQI